MIMGDIKSDDVYEENIKKEKHFKKIWLIVYITMLVIVSWAFPGFSFLYGNQKGWDSGETAMGLFFFYVPLGLAVTILLYTIVTGDIKKALIAYVVCMLPWMFVPFVGSIEFALMFGGGAVIVGVIGWFINLVVVNPMIDKRFRQKKDMIRKQEEVTL